MTFSTNQPLNINIHNVYSYKPKTHGQEQAGGGVKKTQINQ